MDTIADYTAWKAKQQQTGVNAANVVLTNSEAKPDEIAGDLNLASEFGKVTGNPVPPVPLVKEYRNVFQQRIEEERNKTILSTAPRLTEWLRNPENAAVARDDLSNLSWWETGLRATGNAIGRGVRRAPMGYNQYMADQTAQIAADQKRTAGEIYSDVTAIRDGQGKVITHSILPSPGQLFTFLDRMTNARSPLFQQQDMNEVAAQYQQQVGQIQKRIAEIPLSPAGSRFRDTFMKGEAQGSALDQVADFATKFAADPGGALAFLTETAVESVPSIAAATGVTVATRNPAMGALALGGQSYAQERYTSPAEFFTEKGIDISTPEGARKVLSDPALMQEAAQRGVIRGSIIGLLDGLSGGIAGKELAKSPLGNVVLQAITQATLGGTGEALAQLSTDGKVDMREVIVEALAEFVTSPAEVAGVGGRRFMDARRKAKDAEARVALFQELSGQAQASALRNRMPDKFRQFVEAATANGPVENVYVPADQFAQYFQGVGVDPFTIVDELEGVTRDDFEAALAGGGDLQIPTATYAAKIAGTEHDAFLMENMRFDPDEFTAREAAEFNERAQEVMQEAWDIAEATRVEQELNGSYEQEIYDTMVSRLRTAGRATDVATNEAMLYPAFYRVMAERSGMTMDDFLRRYPLPEVKGSLPEGIQLRDVDALTRTLAEARNRRAAGLEKRGPTLLEWISDYGGINDPGGELRARDAETVRRGKGKKTLKLSRSGVMAGMRDMFGSSGKKYGVDDVARAAIEAGYLADNPTANEYRAALNEGRQVPDIGRALFEAIDAELRGDAQYAGEVSAQADDNAALDSIEEYLNSLGVSLENSDEEIRTAIEGARQYAQRPERLAWSEDGSSASLVLTKKEQEFFGDLQGNSGDWQELKERASSFEFDGKSISINQVDMAEFSNFISDIRDGYGGNAIPPRIRSYFQRNEAGARGEGARQYAQAEDEKNLIVQHNLTAANLLHADKMRGLAVPSVAISNVEYPLDGFGEITLLGGPDMIDPRKDSSAKVFDADVYSPRYPTVRYKIATKEMSKVWKRLGKASEDLGHVLSGELDHGEVERKGLEAFRDSSTVQLQFLRDNGRGIELPQEQAKTNYLGKVPELAGLVGEYATPWEIRENADAFAAVKKAVDLEIATVLEARGEGFTEEDVRGWYYDKDGDVRRSVIDNIKYEIKLAKRPGVDRYAARQAIRDAVAPNADEFAAWVDEQFSSVFAGEQVVSETASGDWKYLPHTLDNVVKILKKKLRDGEGFNYGVASIRSNVANQFKSVAAIKAARDRLIPADAMKALKDETNDEFVALAGKFEQYVPGKVGFSFLENFSEHLKEVADRGVRALDQYYAALPDDLKQEAATFLDKLANMPTEYFEAKIQRAVDLSEFKAAVVPKSAPQSAKDVLKYARVPVFEYDPATPGARAATIRAASGQQNLLFQRNEAGARGQIQFMADGQSIIRLFETANLSTMLHESGHYFLTVLQDLASKGEKPNSFAGDVSVRHGFSGRETPEFVSDFSGDRYSGNSFGNNGVYLDNVGHWTANGELSRFPVDRVATGTVRFENALVVSPETLASILKQIPKPNRPELAGNASLYLGEDIEQFARRSGYDGLIVQGFDKKITSYEAERELVERFGAHEAIMQDQIFAFDPSSVKFDDRIYNGGDAIETPLSGTVEVRSGNDAAADFEAVKGWWRENAAAVAADARRAMPDVAVTKEDVIAALDNGTTGDVMKDGAIDVGMQEQWARGFEAYLLEGKAPSAELRSAFEKFRAWLISIYQRLAGLNVTISDDIRAVMDRMLATDEEIRKAKAETGDAGPVFLDAEAMGLTPEEYAGFIKLRSQAEDEAKAKLLRETMAPIKRERGKAYKEEKAKVREEVARVVNAYRYYRALEWMGNRRWIGEGQPVDMPDMRLSKSILVDRYGAGVLETLPRGKQTVYAVDGGVDPDDAAGWFGFDSGDEMIRAMEAAPKRTEAIDAETERVMRERHGDPLNDGSVEAEALDAVHTDKRGQWIAAELKAITEVAELAGALTAKEARASAKDAINRMRVRDAMNANRFLSAERKAAEEAARLGAMLAREGVWMGNARRRIATKARAAVRGDGSVEAVAPQIEQANRSTGNYNETVARLIDAKRKQLINHALYMEARKVTAEVEAAERYVNRLGKASVREKIAGAGRRENAGIDYLATIDELLEQYDFRKMSNRAEQRRGALNAYIEAMKATGRENELSIPESVLNDAKRKPYKTLPVEQLRGVIDSLKNIEHVALRWDKLIDAQNERALDEAVTDIVAAFDANVPKRPPGRVATRSEEAANKVRQFFDLVLNATTLLREIDGFEDGGPAYRNIKAPIDAAMNRLITRKETAAKDLENLYSVYTKDERRRMGVRDYMPELGYSLSKWERISVALNTGNEGNYQRLTDTRVRGSLTPDQVAAVLATLDERDAKFVQSVWDYVGSFKGDIAARERRTTGVEPAWVEATPVTIAGKTLKGGYYPIKYDPRLSSLARDDETQEIAQSLQAGRFGKAQTRNGHIKERAQSSGRDVELDMSVLHRHVNQVIYDLELSEPVANSWRILQDGRTRSAFMESGKQADFDALETWLKDVAEGELRSADLVGRAARTLKSNFTAAKLAFNLVTVAMQITGFSQSMVVVGKKNMVIGMMKTASHPAQVANEVAAKSSFMKSRQTTFNKDIYDFYSDPKTGPIASRWGDIKREYIGPMSFWLMTKTQWHLVDVPTWIAGYEQGLRKYGNDEAKAIEHADGIVKRAQASGLFSDRSAIERGSVSRTARQNDVVRLFTALGSYMFAKFNVAYERSAKASRTIREEGVSTRSAQEALSWTLDMAFLFMLETVVTAVIKGQLPDSDDEDDDGWLLWLAKQTGFAVMATIPVVRDVAGPLQGYDGGGAYGAITKEIAAPFTQAGQGEVDKTFVKSVINATGLATGLPATQINRAVDAGWRQAEGEDVSPLEYLMGRSKK